MAKYKYSIARRLRPPPFFNAAEKAGGNDALALLLTVTTNLLGVISVPFFVKAVLRSSGGASIDAVKLLIKLVRHHRAERERNAER